MREPVGLGKQREKPVWTCSGGTRGSIRAGLPESPPESPRMICMKDGRLEDHGTSPLPIHWLALGTELECTRALRGHEFPWGGPSSHWRNEMGVTGRDGEHHRQLQPQLTAGQTSNLMSLPYVTSIVSKLKVPHAGLRAVVSTISVGPSALRHTVMATRQAGNDDGCIQSPS